MRHAAHCCALLTASMLVGCDKPKEVHEPTPEPVGRTADAFSSRNPSVEAHSAAERGDYKVYSAMGVGYYFPGLDRLIGAYIAGRYSSEMLDGTSDAIESDEHAAYVDAATDFASIYNKEIVAAMRLRNLIPEVMEVSLTSTGWQIGDQTFSSEEKAFQFIQNQTGGDKWVPISLRFPDTASKEERSFWEGLVDRGFRNSVSE